MILPIVRTPDPILRLPAAPVTEVTAEIRELIENMRETMQAAPGVGLAAPQVGVGKQIITIEYQGDNARPIPFIALINPRITWESPQKSRFQEGCLSIPGVYADITRQTSVRVKSFSVDGEELSIRADRIFPRILQHGYDHL